LAQTANAQQCTPSASTTGLNGRRRRPRRAPYVPRPADFAAQAAADRDQEQADRDYRELARLALATDTGACRCGAVKARCLVCRVARWLAIGLWAGAAAAVRYFRNHVDEVGRSAMRRDLLPELNRELAARGVSHRPPAA
jgi:hypothetical protein